MDGYCQDMSWTIKPVRRAQMGPVKDILSNLGLGKGPQPTREEGLKGHLTILMLFKQRVIRTSRPGKGHQGDDE